MLFSLFQAHLSFWPYLAPTKISWW